MSSPQKIMARCSKWMRTAMAVLSRMVTPLVAELLAMATSVGAQGNSGSFSSSSSMQSIADEPMYSIATSNMSRATSSAPRQLKDTPVELMLCSVHSSTARRTVISWKLAVRLVNEKNLLFTKERDPILLKLHLTPLDNDAPDEQWRVAWVQMVAAGCKVMLFDPATRTVFAAFMGSYFEKVGGIMTIVCSPYRWYTWPASIDHGYFSHDTADRLSIWYGFEESSLQSADYKPWSMLWNNRIHEVSFLRTFITGISKWSKLKGKWFKTACILLDSRWSFGAQMAQQIEWLWPIHGATMRYMIDLGSNATVADWEEAVYIWGGEGKKCVEKDVLFVILKRNATATGISLLRWICSHGLEFHAIWMSYIPNYNKFRTALGNLAQDIFTGADWHKDMLEWSQEESSKNERFIESHTALARKWHRMFGGEPEYQNVGQIKSLLILGRAVQYAKSIDPVEINIHMQEIADRRMSILGGRICWDHFHNDCSRRSATLQLQWHRPVMELELVLPRSLVKSDGAQPNFPMPKWEERDDSIETAKCKQAAAVVVSYFRLFFLCGVGLFIIFSFCLARLIMKRRRNHRIALQEEQAERFRFHAEGSKDDSSETDGRSWVTVGSATSSTGFTGEASSSFDRSQKRGSEKAGESTDNNSWSRIGFKDIRKIRLSRLPSFRCSSGSLRQNSEVNSSANSSSDRGRGSRSSQSRGEVNIEISEIRHQRNRDPLPSFDVSSFLGS